MKPVTALIVTLILTFLVPLTVIAEEANLEPHLHKIILSNSAEGISPNLVSLKQGDTVVWYNQDKEPVVISFIQKLGIVCSPIINFYADLSGSYKTEALPLGGTASLCFIKQGEYEYEVKRILNPDKKKSKEQVLKGKIIVK
jgi:plastocyanin